MWLSSTRRNVSDRGPVLTPKELELLRSGHSTNGSGERSMGITQPTDVPPSSLPGAGPGAGPMPGIGG